VSAQEQHRRRDAVARQQGYRRSPLPPAVVEYAGERLHEHVDEQAARAARTLRGLAPDDRGEQA
jgi:hypothetical protein